MIINCLDVKNFYSFLLLCHRINPPDTVDVEVLHTVYYS